jgi:hypothetical protein
MYWLLRRTPYRGAVARSLLLPLCDCFWRDSVGGWSWFDYAHNEKLQTTAFSLGMEESGFGAPISEGGELHVKGF